MMSIMTRKSAALAAAVLAIGASTITFSDAEARWRGHYRGAGLAAGIVGGALIGGALLAPRVYAHPYSYSGPIYVDEPAECYIQRQRVWSERRGRYILVNREICD